MTNRSLMPREHGAYAELLLPLLTGLAIGRPGTSALAFAASAALAFLLYEPWTVLAGARGNRARDLLATRAKRRVVVLGAGAGALASLAITTASTQARLAALVPLAAAVLLAPLAVTGRVKTLTGEFTVMVTLTATLLPVGVAGGAPWSYALSAWVVWCVSFGLGTLTVHAIKAKSKGDRLPQWPIVAAPALAFVAIIAAVSLAATGTVPRMVGLAVLPPSIAMLVMNLLRVHPRRLRTVGWSLVAANLLTAILLIAGR